METKEIKKKKIIDIPENTFRSLSIKAASEGLNLKKYIENLLIKDVEDMNDSITYEYLSKTRPDGKVLLDKKEKNDFEGWLALNDL